MDYKVTFPDENEQLPCMMKKFFIVTDDATISFIIQDKFSENLLRKELNELSKEDLTQVVDLVKTYYSEDEIGQGELSKVTKVAQIQRFL